MHFNVLGIQTFVKNWKVEERKVLVQQNGQLSHPCEVQLQSQQLESCNALSAVAAATGHAVAASEVESTSGPVPHPGVPGWRGG